MERLMRKVYLLNYGSQIGPRSRVKRYLNAMDSILSWRYELPFCFFVVSEHDAEDLADEFRKLTGPEGKFVFSQIGENYQGWLTEAGWYLIQTGYLKPKKEDD